jgi:ABC-type dipeptide/oligopeptide/nickel transport system ATPase component
LWAHNKKPKILIKFKPRGGKVADNKNDLYIGVKSDLSPFNIDLNALTRGLVVIGQSGCGKSFLLGRLIEEIYRQTTEKTQILIFDPNSDFYYGSELKSKTKEFKKCYDKYYIEQLKDEHKEFSKLEKKCYDDLKSKHKNTQIFGKTEEYNLSWDYVINDYKKYDKLIKAGSTTLDYRGEKRSLISHLSEQKFTNLKDYQDAITELSLLLNNIKVESKYFSDEDIKFREKYSQVKSVEELGEDIYNCSAPLWRMKENTPGLPESLFKTGRLNILELENIRDNTDRNIVNAYILLFCLERHNDLINSYRKIKGSGKAEDIEKAEKELKHTFIMIDEAHNFAPEASNDPHEKMLGELIHTIAAEGRKYGLHLILATQRPNKVKRGLLGECDNAIIMKMNSRSDLEHLSQEMRILDVKLLEPCLHFQGQGNALAVGEMTRMAPYVQLFKSAPRRTVEGGVDIPDF